MPEIRYHPSYGPLTGRAAQGYFVGGSGLTYDYGRLKIELKNTMHYPKGKHIIKQLEFLGIREDFEAGATPCSLPYTFAE